MTKIEFDRNTLRVMALIPYYFSGTVLFSGSRKSADKFITLIPYFMQRIKQVDSKVIVGDASGIDTMVINSCIEHKIPLTVCGISDLPRNGREYLGNDLFTYKKIESDVFTSAADLFLNRDRFMADNALIGIFLWNGLSRGTKYTHDYMRELNKKVVLITDLNGDWLK